MTNPTTTTESKIANLSMEKAPKMKLAASALASVAATVSSADAVLVQIDLTGNQISNGGGDQLNADVSGDGSADIAISVYSRLAMRGPSSTDNKPKRSHLNQYSSMHLLLGLPTQLAAPPLPEPVEFSSH